MYAIRTYIFIKCLNRLRRGLSEIAELLVITEIELWNSCCGRVRAYASVSCLFQCYSSLSWLLSSSFLCCQAAPP